MNQKGNKYYFLGIGGIGMSAIAKYLFDKGNKVMGYDKTPSPITAKLIDSGITVLFDALYRTTFSSSPKSTSAHSIQLR